QVDHNDPSIIFANNYGGGNFLSTNSGKSWVDASSGYTGSGILQLAVDSNKNGRVVAGVHSGIYLSSDYGDNWTSLYPKGGWQTVAIDPADGDIIIAAAADGILMRTTDGGTSWDEVMQRIGDEATWRGTTFVPNDPSTIFTGSSSLNLPDLGTVDPGAEGVFRSEDSGATWAEVNDGTSEGANIRNMACSPDGNILFAATSNKGVLKTTNGAQSWSDASNGLPDAQFISIAMDPNDGNVVLAGTFMSGLYRTGDGGQSWSAVATGVPAEATVRAIVFHPTESNVYAGDSRSGVYESTDSGQSWELINDGFLNRSNNALAIAADGRWLYSGSDGSGAYRMRLAD
ncbi:MAG: hypothetical protein HN348_25235, partial [Proteobacteria bacterium]|nr:hypothetical protein [Pseudomonadota bacterium]